MSKAGAVVKDYRRDYCAPMDIESESGGENKELRYKEVDVNDEINQFPLIPTSGRVYVVQAEVEQTGGGLYVPVTAKKDGEMQTNFGWVVGLSDDVTVCRLGDKIFYGRYSGSWVMDQRYRVMNEVDILGIFKESR